MNQRTPISAATTSNFGDKGLLRHASPLRRAGLFFPKTGPFASVRGMMSARRHFHSGLPDHA